MSKLPLIAVLVAPLLLAACNTTAGVGKDVKSAGSELEKAANDAKD